MKAVLRVLDTIERIATWLAAAMMFAIMIIVTADVAMRYVFNAPLGWAYDLISLYLMAGVFFLVLSHAFAEGAHVSVDILQQRFPDWAFRSSEIVTAAVSAVVFALITKVGWDRTVDAYQSADVVAGAIPWPTWPAAALVPFGAGLLTLRLVVHGISLIIGLTTGHDLMPLRRHAHGEEAGFE